MQPSLAFDHVTGYDLVYSEWSIADATTRLLSEGYQSQTVSAFLEVMRHKLIDKQVILVINPEQ